MKAGRELAAQRRKAGLPWKRSEGGVGDPAAGRGRVKRGSYAGKPAGTAPAPAADQPGAKPAKVKRPTGARRAPEKKSGDGLSGLDRLYGKLSGRL